MVSVEIIHRKKPSKVLSEPLVNMLFLHTMESRRPTQPLRTQFQVLAYIALTAGLNTLGPCSLCSSIPTPIKV